MAAGERGLQTNYVSGTSQMERKKHNLLPPPKSASEEIIKAKSSEGSYCKRNSYPGRNAYENRSALVMRDEKDSPGHDRGQENFHLGQRSRVLYVALPLHARSSSGKGVEVGDEFQYRVELNMIGLHLQIQGGIDYVKHEGKINATSIVASGGYDDKLDNSDVLIYTGQGGNVMNGGKEPEDQKLERGNVALANNIHEQNPVRVIRGDTKAFEYRTCIYDGLYLVERYWQDVGSHGKLVYKFKLARIPDDEMPPSFKYITNIIYPDWCRPVPPKGCDCTNGCSKLEKCACVAKNGGEIPYNHNRAIVQAKLLVYECGPSCKCPPSCYNRVSQQGIKVQLEIYKTEARGWGVRSLNSIAPGSFIYEFVGELLEEKEAERRTSNDKYLFNIGNNYNDGSLWGGLSNVMPDAPSSSCGVVEDGGFTIN
ncbi:Histone-lysine N-methyltransferase H3 lysine-9 specific SUVH6 [Citrus sinensis]|nr:Histone-lysine N-methyltransferase H3 lysine-9 specific SUVH6 [Citrus sinensis]